MKAIYKNNPLRIFYKNKNMLRILKYINPEALTYDYTTVPRVDILWYNPKQYNNINIEIPIYMTDWYMREYNLDDYSLDFILNVEVDGVLTTYDNMKAGEHTISLGVLEEGEHWFSLEVIDKAHNISSSVIYQEILIVDAANYGFKENEIYTITDNDFTTYSITPGLTADTATEEAMINNRKGLTKLFADLQSQGYRKCILPENTVFRVNRANREPYTYDIEGGTAPIIIPTQFTVDMNGSTFKLHPYDDREYGNKGQVQNLMVCFLRCYDSHLINGTIEGDFSERLSITWEDGTNAISGGNGEGCNCIAIYGGKYNTTENITITQVTGYNYAVTQNGENVGKITGTSNWTENLNIINGKNIEMEGYTSTAGFLMMNDEFLTNKYIIASVWLGYGGIKGHYWTMWFHFYDDNYNHIKTIKGTQYRRTRIPEGARYFKATYIQATVNEMNNLSFHYMGSPTNCGAYNCHWIDNRTCANPNQYRHFTFKDCDFTRSGQSITPCEIDLEDGWEAGMDMFIKDCQILENVGTGDLIQNCGHNIVIDNCTGWSLTFRYRILGITIKNCKDITVDNTLGYMTKHTIRIFDNTISKLGFSNTSADPNFYKNVRVRYKNNIIKGISSGSELFNLDNGNTIIINNTYRDVSIKGNKIYFENDILNNGNTFFTNCDIYSNGDYTTKIRMNGDAISLRVFNNCTFYNDVEVWGNAHVYLGTAIFNNCTFKGTVTMTRPVNNTIGDIAFNNCTLESDFNVNIQHENAWVQLNKCIINGSINYSGTYGQSNTQINDELPFNIYAFRMSFKNGTLYHNINTTDELKFRMLPYASTELYTLTTSNNNASVDKNGLVTFISEGDCDVICTSKSGYSESLTMHNVNIDYGQQRFDSDGNVVSSAGLKYYVRYDYIPIETNNCNAQIFVPTHYASVGIVQYDSDYNVINAVINQASVNNDTTNNNNYTTDFTLDSNTAYIRICFSTNGYTKAPIIELFARAEIVYL